MVLKNKKKHMILGNNNVGVGDDKISKLPNELIHHILSFLPTKCVMSTCILSKRWKYVSNSIPTLDFREWQATNVTAEEKPLKTQQFMNFLDTVLYLHEKPNIQKFYLSWNGLFDESRVNKWIGIAIKRKVEELYLSAETRTFSVFPLSFFTCDSLTVLDLNRVEINVSNTVSFPRLKLLQLVGVQFANGISLNKLLSNCPILEDLLLLQCFRWGSKVIGIANIALENLYIDDCYFGDSTLKICAPKLLTISYGMKTPGDFVIDSFPSLVEADISMDFAARASVIIKLLEKISNIKLLKMSDACFLLPREADILLLPAFNNLIHIEVSSGPCYWASESSDFVSPVRRFFRFLQLSPNLESIVFVHRIRIREKEHDGCWSLDPKCSPPHLKSIKFMYCDGEPMELNAIKLLLKYVGFLETVTIVASSQLSKNHKKLINVMKLLLMIPRPANCVVKLLTSSENA